MTTTFPRPMSFDTTESAARANVRCGFLEKARQELRGSHSALVELRRSSLAWDCPGANFRLIPITEQIASALALLEEME